MLNCFLAKSLPDDSTQAMKIVMLAEKKLSWSSTTQWSNLSYQYAATLVVAHRLWHVAEQIFKSLAVGKSEHSLACHAYSLLEAEKS